MSGVIHGRSTAAMKWLRSSPAALAVYWCYVARANSDGVAWPSLRGLALDTGWNKDTCAKARRLLVAKGALVRANGYVRPQWRELDERTLVKRLRLDQNEYYRVTGLIKTPEGVVHLLYFGGNDENPIDG